MCLPYTILHINILTLEVMGVRVSKCGVSPIYHNLHVICDNNFAKLFVTNGTQYCISGRATPNIGADVISIIVRCINLLTEKVRSGLNREVAW